MPGTKKSLADRRATVLARFAHTRDGGEVVGDKGESIKQPSDVSTSDTGVPRATDAPPLSVTGGAIPDWCNLGIVLRVVLGVNAIFFGVAAGEAATLRAWLDQCLKAAVTLEPVLVTSLLLGCLIKRLLSRVGVPVQVAVTVAVPAILTVALQTELAPLIQDDAALLLRNALTAALVCGVVLYWSYLRGRSNLPALAEARLEALQARIRPHFFFNSLNAVLGLIRRDPKRAETVLEDLADLFRVLMRDRRDRVTLEEELALCRQYLDIESVRLGDRLKVRMDIDAGVEGALVPLLLLQPLVENAVHHGIEPAATPGTIEIQVVRHGSFVDILIVNPWLGTGQARHGNQIGLDNVRQRLLLLHDLEAQLVTAVRDGRFELRLRLPFMQR